jgi:hypothetical protein
VQIVSEQAKKATVLSKQTMIRVPTASQGVCAFEIMERNMNDVSILPRDLREMSA